MSDMPADPFGRSRLPADLQARADIDQAAQERTEREEFAQRARWVQEVAAELLGGSPASRAARLFVGHGLDRTVAESGDLLSVLRLRPRRGSKRTARRVLGVSESSSR